jgi:hypothetical protein
MHLAPMDRAGDDLHWVIMRAIAPNRPDRGIAAHEHAVPIEQGFIGEHAGKILMEIDHHLRDAALGGRDARSLRVEAKLMAQGSLNAFPIEDFPFDLRSLDRLFADQFDAQPILLVSTYMFEDPHDLAGPKPEQTLELFQSARIERKIRPVRLFPGSGPRWGSPGRRLKERALFP